MSSSDGRTDFDDWMREHFTLTEGFTVVIVLLAVGERSVLPLSSTFLHVIGTEVTWPEFAHLLGGAGLEWEAVVLFPTAAPEGGPIDDALARERQREIERRLIADRMIINRGGFFDRWGRRMTIEEAATQ